MSCPECGEDCIIDKEYREATCLGCGHSFFF